MQGESSEQLRAWVEYFHDLGVHEFYRNGEPVAIEATVAVVQEPAVSVAPPVVESAAPALGFASDTATTISTTISLMASAVVSNPPLSSDTVAATALKSFDELALPPGEPLPVGERTAALEAIREYIGDCTRCPLAYAGRRTIVFGDGSPGARLMFIGEGPGADEDTQGLPFVGKAGQLLNNMINAMGLKREEVYIANIVKCRPPANRVPEPAEANTCTQFLVRQIDVVRPEVIVALGSTAATYVLGMKRSLSSLRGNWYSSRGAKVVVTYHPAFLLRDPNMKGEAWKDLQMVMKELGLKRPS